MLEGRSKTSSVLQQESDRSRPERWLSAVASWRPSAHFMAFAPLDVWWMMLRSVEGRIGVRYWPRLAACLGTSALGTAITLPERLLWQPALRRQYRMKREVDHEAGALFVLGHYRSGTTHLHYLLSCDERLYTPKWYQCLAPHGYVCAWTFLRVFLVPFISERRPQDDVSLGPDWPAEDEFAVNNLALASALPGRFVVPGAFDRFTQFHDLIRLDEDAREWWRQAQWQFLTKLSWRAGRKRALLLKSPGHTAHVGELVRLFPADRLDTLQCVHIARDAEEVVRSNFNMIKRLIACYGLQHAPNDRLILERVIDEYARSQRAFARDRELIPAGNLACIHYEDLCADPVGTLRHVYERLNMPWSGSLERRLAAYLDSLGAHGPATRGGSERLALLSVSQRELLRELSAGDVVPLGRMLRCVPSRGTGVKTIEGEAQTRAEQWWNPWVMSGAVAAAVAAAWTVCAILVGNRMDTLVWPAGLLIGWTALRSAKRWKGRRGGSWKLGVWAAALTVLVLPAIAHPVTKYTYYRNHPQASAKDIWTTAWHEMSAGATLFWLFMGTATAYRYGSRSRVPPGAD